jgi:acetyl esterase/lipase
MRRTVPWTFLLGLIAALFCSSCAEAQEPNFTRKRDVIYNFREGIATTMDVFTPHKANGAAIIEVVSGGFNTSRDAIRPAYPVWVGRGYTVFAVVQGNQPRFQPTDMAKDLTRAVRYIRYNAKDFGIDPQKIGVTGASSGGCLSLLTASVADDGKPNAKDPVDRVSGRVQAVACFFPITDWLNFGGPGKERLQPGDHPKGLGIGFGFLERDADGSLTRVADREKQRSLARSISPIWQVTKEYPPALIYHGDKDNLVPIEQSQRFIEKLKEAGVENKLVVKTGAGHGWNLAQDQPAMADWFDLHMKVAPNR